MFFFIQIHILYDKQCRSRSVGFLSQPIWIYIVYGQGMSGFSRTRVNTGKFPSAVHLFSFYGTWKTDFRYVFKVIRRLLYFSRKKKKKKKKKEPGKFRQAVYKRNIVCYFYHLLSFVSAISNIEKKQTNKKERKKERKNLRSKFDSSVISPTLWVERPFDKESSFINIIKEKETNTCLYIFSKVPNKPPSNIGGTKREV